MGIDQTAADLQTHEAVCAERYGHIMEALSKGDKRMGRIEQVMIVCAGACITGLVAVAWDLIQKHL